MKKQDPTYADKYNRRLKLDRLQYKKETGKSYSRLAKVKFKRVKIKP